MRSLLASATTTLQKSGDETGSDQETAGSHGGGTVGHVWDGGVLGWVGAGRVASAVWLGHHGGCWVGWVRSNGDNWAGSRGLAGRVGWGNN